MIECKYMVGKWKVSTDDIHDCTYDLYMYVHVCKNTGLVNWLKLH